jgi:hypothetical protein
VQRVPSGLHIQAARLLSRTAAEIRCGFSRSDNLQATSRLMFCGSRYGDRADERDPHPRLAQSPAKFEAGRDSTR